MSASSKKFISSKSMSTNDEADIQEMLEATERIRAKKEMVDMYSKLRNEREKTTFAMMMKMNPEALTLVRKEFFMRSDQVNMHEFIYIIQKHLSNRSSAGEQRFELNTKEKREFALNVCQLFKEIDVNGDGGLEWQEFTQFVVEKANALNKRMKITTIAHYTDSTTSLDPSAFIRHRNDISRMINLPSLGQIALVEDQRNQIFIMNAKKGQYIQNHPGDIKTEAAPVALVYVEDTQTLVASLANMTMATYSVDDPNVVRNYSTLSTWATPGVQMALTYMSNNKLLYSGATNGDIYSWKIKERKLCDTLSGHSDIVMSLVTLKKINYVASGSFDKTISVWDAYTNQQLLKLYGHKKGVIGLDYAPDYRLLFSAGFEHDACVWSPFVSSCVYRLKGHHASLAGVQVVENTPEVITADVTGVMKLWDIRTFQCVQTFTANLSGQRVKDSSKLGCFVQCKIPQRNSYKSSGQMDSRVYCASKLVVSFDQHKEEKEPRTDDFNVIWMEFCDEALTIVTASEQNVIIWDAILGSKSSTINNICGNEITACCMDDRKRKIIVGDNTGAIGVYNSTSGVLMKNTAHDVPHLVVKLQYLDEHRRFLAGYDNGLIRLYDESSLEQCPLLMNYDVKRSHPELLSFVCNEADNTLATFGASSGILKIWNTFSGKLEEEFDLCGESDHIVQIAYLLPLPLVAVSDSCGNVVIFGYSKGAKWVGKRISGFLNQTPTKAEYEENSTAEDDYSEDDLAPRRISFPDTDEFNVEDDVLDSPKPDGKLTRSRLAHLGGHHHDKHKTRSRSSSRASVTSSGGAGGDTEEDRRPSNMGLSQETIDALNFLDRKATEDRLREAVVESEKKWGKVTAPQAFAWDYASTTMYTADAMGNLRSFCMADMINLNKKHPTTTTDAAAARPGIHFHPRSAMPPLPVRDKYYSLGVKTDATVYLGVKFNWALEAHQACILFCRLVPHGVLTAATDRLVKMWSRTGEYLGVLYDSVPEGVRSHNWALDIDVEAAIGRENEVVDDIAVEVHDLLVDPNKPELEEYNFKGLNGGDDAPEFTRSELRARIDESSHIIGVDFSRKKPTESLGEDFDEGSFKSLSLSSVNNASTGKAVSMVPFDFAATNVEIGLTAAKSIGSLGSVGSHSLGAPKKSDQNLPPVQVPVKHFGDALKELKSADAAVDDEVRNQHLSDIQFRRKQAKMIEIAEIYEQKTGIAVGTFLGEAGEIHQYTKELEGNPVEHRSSVTRKKAKNNKVIGSERIVRVESTHDIGIEQLLKASVSPEERKEREINANADLYRPPKLKAAMAAAANTANAMNLNMVSTRSSHINTYRSSTSAGQSPQPQRGSPSQKPSMNVNMSMSMSASLTNTAEMNPSLTATATASSSLTKRSDYKGEREEYIRKTCSIFSNFDNLEKSLSKASHGVHRLTQEQREKLEEMRENKKLRERERAMMSAKHKKSGSRIHSNINSRVGSRLVLAREGEGDEDASGAPLSVDQSQDGVITEDVGMYLSMDEEGVSSRDDNLASTAEKSFRSQPT